MLDNAEMDSESRTAHGHDCHCCFSSPKLNNFRFTRCTIICMCPPRFISFHTAILLHAHVVPQHLGMDNVRRNIHFEIMGCINQRRQAEQRFSSCCIIVMPFVLRILMVRIAMLHNYYFYYHIIFGVASRRVVRF